MKNTFKFMAGMMAVGLTVSTQAQNLVSNGGFETGDLTGWSLIGALASAPVLTADDGIPVHSGSYAVGLYGFDAFPTDKISQTLTTTPGESYTLDFWWNSKILTAPNEFGVAWNGVSVFDVQNQSGGGWTEETFSVTATSASTILSFNDYVPDGNGVYTIDDISVVPAPEPATLALSALGGLAGLVANRRRK